MSPRPSDPLKIKHPDWPEPTHEQHIREMQIEVYRSAASALEACAKVLRRGAETLEKDA